MSHFKYMIKNEFQKTLNHFSTLMNVRIAFFSLDGKEVKVGKGFEKLCRFCRLFRENLENDMRCRALDASKRQEALSSEEMISYRCHAGMNEAIIPVPFAGHFIGFIMIGQYRTHSKMPLSMIKDFPSKHFADIANAYQKAPFYSDEANAHLLGLFSEIVIGITSRTLIKAHIDDVVDQLVAYLYDNMHRNISLSEASSYVKRSPSRIRHLFSNRYQKSFKQFQIGIKLDFAERLLVDNLNKSIQEVATQIGYNDVFYFSRLFKKYKGVSPSVIRKSC